MRNYDENKDRIMLLSCYLKSLCIISSNNIKTIFLCADRSLLLSAFFALFYASQSSIYYNLFNLKKQHHSADNYFFTQQHFRFYHIFTTFIAMNEDRSMILSSFPALHSSRKKAPPQCGRTFTCYMDVYSFMTSGRTFSRYRRATSPAAVWPSAPANSG